MDLKVHKLKGELADAIHDDVDRAALGGGWANRRGGAKNNHEETARDYSQNSLGIAINHGWNLRLMESGLNLSDIRANEGQVCNLPALGPALEPVASNVVKLAKR
jgi:hypothetical protein